MCIYHATAKSNTLPFDNRETPIIIIISIVFLHIIMIDLLIRCSLKAE